MPSDSHAGGELPSVIWNLLALITQLGSGPFVELEAHLCVPGALSGTGPTVGSGRMHRVDLWGRTASSRAQRTPLKLEIRVCK